MKKRSNNKNIWIVNSVLKILIPLPVSVVQIPQDSWHSSPFVSHFPCFTKNRHFHAGEASLQSAPNFNCPIKSIGNIFDFTLCIRTTFIDIGDMK